jgi:ligand-binding SRPBCC domain-containing protein
MPLLHITNVIYAPIEVVFDLSRNITLHKLSQRDHSEEVIAGVTSGCINKDETVTWRAKHLMRTRVMQVKITAMEKYSYFCDEQIRGDFKSFHHEHHFKSIENGTIMIDILRFETPYGLLGKIFNLLYLERYMKELIERRNNTIRSYAESEKWKALLR